MTSEAERIRDQLRRALAGEAWHGPSALEAVNLFDEQNAFTRVPADGHSACELVLHMAVWLEIARARFEGVTFTPTHEQDWPAPGNASRESWNAALARLHAAHADLDHALSVTTDAQLNAMAPGKDYTMYVMLHGAVQHTIYHAGQLMLIARVLGAPKTGA